MPKVIFYTATAAQYAALEEKNPQALYFITDTGEFYKGTTRFSFPAKIVETFPATGETGILYIDKDGAAKIWNGTEYITLAGGEGGPEWRTE